MHPGTAAVEHSVKSRQSQNMGGDGSSRGPDRAVTRERRRSSRVLSFAVSGAPRRPPSPPMFPPPSSSLLPSSLASPRPGPIPGAVAGRRGPWALVCDTGPGSWDGRSPRERRAVLSRRRAVLARWRPHRPRGHLGTVWAPCPACRCAGREADGVGAPETAFPWAFMPDDGRMGGRDQDGRRSSDAVRAAMGLKHPAVPLRGVGSTLALMGLERRGRIPWCWVPADVLSLSDFQ